MSREANPLMVSQVVGDVLDHFTATTALQVFYDGQMICNGYRLRPSQIAVRPRVEIGDNFRNFYTLVMVDPDAPSPGNSLVTNIPGSTGPAFGNEIVSYEGPQPTLGIHRLVLVVLRQPAGRLTVNAPEWRQNFNVRQFSEQYNLGSPVAAMYYNCNREHGTGGRRAF